MADSTPVSVPLKELPQDAAMQQTHWRMERLLSSVGDRIDAFLDASGFDRGPWLAVAFSAGIGAWFVLATAIGWLCAAVVGILGGMAAQMFWRHNDRRAHLRAAIFGVGLAFSLGVAVVWAKSSLVGTEPIAHPIAGTFDARVLERIEQPADGRARLVLAMREPETSRAVKVRVNLPLDKDILGLGEGARIRVKARLMPPAPPLLPGSYDFSRAAWFDGLAATGSVVAAPELLEPAAQQGGFGSLQRRLADHVRSRLDGSAGTIAAALASGDRGAIAGEDEAAMRDAGLSHLLSISGLHVSAVIAAAYFMAIRLLALWQWLALRIRLPVAAAAIAALAGIGYTLLTGAEVPTVRSCVGAVLVLLALALGREPLSLRLIAVAAGFVLLLWPEALVGPSFQMSFSAVIAIVALHSAGPVRAFLASRDEGWLVPALRRGTMLLVTGLVIEFALMPVVMFHFHRAGLYGAFANVIAIPLTTFVSMPLIALALALDAIGLGAPAWWLAGKSLEFLLALAHFTADQPGAVKLMPQMGKGTFALFIAGSLWLALWRGRVRLWAVLPLGVACVLLAITPVPDVLISRDGREVGITGEDERLLVLRESRSTFARETLQEMAGAEGEVLAISQWSGARCSADFCVATLKRQGREWHLLLALSKERIDERQLAAACDLSDIVVADRYLPRSCRPRWIKADRRSLDETGGLALYLNRHEMKSVAEGQGEHGWWRNGKARRYDGPGAPSRTYP
ncbi:ComEC/Rec2 family competence protein [Erythrobacter sp. SG61-1L]|uniref:ComEC/Rec2 family competence protein n=1 Tax=Erythrobacter sp. SG61-1L TaxID=1603897 RepID=UPI0006C8F114|nr:ComEC/Rec2 family competence protein [Erythrobacter sp. SG61-1L]